MNTLDFVILAALVVAAVGGYRLGFVARALSWAGLAAALLVAISLVPELARGLAGTAPRGRLFAILAFVIGLSLLGQALGLAIGAVLHARLPLPDSFAAGDHVAGAAVGAVGILVFVWMLVPALASSAGWPARAARGSAIVATIERVAPAPPASLRELGRMVAEAPFPQVLGATDQPGDAGAPPLSGLDPAAGARVAASVVRVEGHACDQIQDGTGWVVAPELVVTNAHVVAGERRTSVDTPAGDRFTARVVSFDPRRDLALLRVPGLPLAALSRVTGAVGNTGAVYGHPGGGPLRAAPARVAEELDASGTDIYRTSQTRRDVYVLAASLAPGDSGAPLADARGRVIGTAFAIDPGNTTTAYALTLAELAPMLASVPTTTAETGSCLVG